MNNHLTQIVVDSGTPSTYQGAPRCPQDASFPKERQISDLPFQHLSARVGWPSYIFLQDINLYQPEMRLKCLVKVNKEEGEVQSLFLFFESRRCSLKNLSQLMTFPIKLSAVM